MAAKRKMKNRPPKRQFIGVKPDKEYKLTYKSAGSSRPLLLGVFDGSNPKAGQFIQELVSDRIREDPSMHDLTIEERDPAWKREQKKRQERARRVEREASDLLDRWGIEDRW